MKELIITPQRVFISEGFEKWYDLGSMECAFGNVVSMLEGEFPSDNYDQPGYISKVIIDKLSGKGKSKEIWGMHESGSVMHTIYHFLNGEDKITLSLKAMEEMRILHGLTINFLPINQINLDEGIKFKNVRSITDVVYSILYYYAYNGYKLVKCEHCGRWFVTNTFKNKYCPRKSTFDGYTHLKCEQAVRNISQELQREKKRIYNNMTTYKDSSNPDVYSFLDECAFYHGEIKKRATVKNLKAYFDFLKRTKEGEL